MTGILIATHGDLAEGLLNAIELLAGKQEKIETIGLYHGDGIDAFAQEVEKTYEKLNGEDGVLVFVDILGGSPSNAVMKLMNEKDNVKAIAGVTLPMVIQAVFMREDCSADELCSLCYQAGAEGQVFLHEKYKEMMAETVSGEEDDFE